MRITVGNDEYEVDDSYAHKTPEEQQAIQDDIAQQAGIHNEVSQQVATETAQNNAPPSSAADISNPNSTLRKVVDPTLQYGSMALHGANQFLNSPVGHLAEGAAAAYYGGSKLGSAAKAFTNTSGLSNKLDQGLDLLKQHLDTAQAREARLNARPGFGGAGAPSASVAPTAQPLPGQVPNTNVRMPTNMAGPIPPEAPVGGAPVAPGAVPPASPQAAPTAENFLSRMTQMAKQYAPQVAETASDVAGRVGRVIAPVARIAGSAPALGAQLMLHSGGLNTNEDEELRLMHQKQDIEKQRLANQHAQEWNKYKDAKIKALGSM